MADERPINAKPFSSSSLIPTQSSTTISDISSLKVTNLASSSLTAKYLSPIVDTSVIQSYLPLNTTTQVSGTLQYCSALTNPSQITDLIGGQDPTPNENNNQTEDISTENQLKQYLTNLRPNILNTYDQATYHLKIFLAKADKVIKGRELSIDQLLQKDPTLFDDENILIIAESGVNAGIGIKSFSIVNAISLDPQYNTSGVNATLELEEPLGANFIDYYNDAIDQLGYDTRQQAPVFVEISFRGYDENGNYMVVDDVGTKIYRMMMNNISGQFTGTGATYSITLAVLSDVARQMAHSSLHDNLTVQGRTVQDFYDKIMAEFNKYQKDVEADNTQPPAQPAGASGAVATGQPTTAAPASTTNVEKPTPTEKNVYAYNVDNTCVQYSDCMTWEVGKASNPDRLRSADTVHTDTSFTSKQGVIEATWASGTDRTAILYDVLYSTKEAQSLIVNGKKEGEIRPGSKPPGGISYLPEVDIGVEFLEYNEETHTYNKKIIYSIQERQTTQIFSTPDEIQKSADNPDALKEKMAFVRRRYDYFGTGKNTEILDLAIKVEKDLLINLPAYNAQKRTAVADNPGTGTTEIQGSQVAGSNLARLSEGVRPASPTNPDAAAAQIDPSNGSKTSPETGSDIVVTLPSTNPILNTSSLSLTTSASTALNQSQYYTDLGNITSQANALDTQYLALSPSEQISRKDEFNSKYAQLGQQLKTLNSSAPTTSSIYADANSIANTQIASLLGQTKSLDSVSQDTRSITQLGSNTVASLPATGTSQYGATTDYNSKVSVTPTARNDSLTVGTKTFLEDLSRNQASSPKSDIQYRRSTVATSTQNSGGYNLDDSSTLGKSFITALLGQVYGGFGDMNQVTMEVRGDPLWLGVINKAHNDQMGSLVVKGSDGNPLPPSDHKLLLVVVFPRQYDENTGLAIPDKISEGYTALYNLKTVTSNFQDGKFTQTLTMYQDISTSQVRKYIDPQGGANI